jgi:hypothetical protein
LLTTLLHWGNSVTFSKSDLLLENYQVLPIPDDLNEASLWMLAGVKKIAMREIISSGDFDKLIAVAHQAGDRDPDNAYWRQMEAVFLQHSLKVFKHSPAETARLHQELLNCWITAAKRKRWDDYQTGRIKSVQQQLASEFGGPAAWQFAAVYSKRSTDAVLAIQAVGRDLLRSADPKSSSFLLLRYYTLINGKLLRDGARSLVIGECGASMVEFASYPNDLKYPPPPRKLVFARTALYNELWKGGYKDQARDVDLAFKDNEGWLALTGRADIPVKTEQLRIASLITVSVPGALLIVSLFGGILWGLSSILKARPKLLKVVEPPIAPVIGLVLAVVLYAVTRLFLASIAVCACFGFLAFTPTHERSKAPEQMGPVFELTVFALSVVMAVLGVVFVLGMATPGCQVLADFDAPKELYGGSTLLLGLCGIVLGLLLLAAPCWGMIQRIPTPAVVVLALRQFGRGLFLGALALAIVITPVAVFADNVVRLELQHIVGNEPLYYLYNA